MGDWLVDSWYGLYRRLTKQPSKIVTMTGRMAVNPDIYYEATQDDADWFEQVNWLTRDTSLSVRRSDNLAPMEIDLNNEHRGDFPKGCKLPELVPLRYLLNEKGSLEEGTFRTFDICKKQTRRTGNTYRVTLKTQIDRTLGISDDLAD